MTAETSSAMAQPDPARSPAAAAHPARPHQRSEHASRVRYLGKLRRHPAIAALIDPGSDTV